MIFLVTIIHYLNNIFKLCKIVNRPENVKEIIENLSLCLLTMLWLCQFNQLLDGDNTLQGDLQLQFAGGHLAGLRVQ